MSNLAVAARAAVGCAWIICACGTQLSACTQAVDDESQDAGSCPGVGRTYPVGARWTCSDGCNFCECVASDEGPSVSSTLIFCGDLPGPAANMLLCSAEDGVHKHGDTWWCGEPVSCTCVDGKIERHTAP